MSTIEPGDVLVEREDAIATVVLNRPAAMNALSRATRVRLHDAIVALDAEPQVRVIILTGAGDRACSAGLDLKELGSSEGALDSLDENGRQADPVRAIKSCRTTIIAAVNGVAITGGFELALACDFIIASSRARFADTHARVGVIPGWGLSQRLSRTIGIGRAKMMSLTGNFIDSETAERWGLVAMVVEPERLLYTVRALAAEIAATEPGMVLAYKDLIDDGFALSFNQALALESERSAASNATLSADAVEARRETVRRRGSLQ